MLAEGRCYRSSTTVGHLKGVSGTILCASNHREKWYMPVEAGQVRCLIGHPTSASWQGSPPTAPAETRVLGRL